MTSRRASARAAIATVARALADERPNVVFVGGTVTALYPFDEDADIRPTDDVDCVVDVRTTADYYAFIERLRPKGFAECTDQGAPLCRYVHSGIRVDVGTTRVTGIGDTNRWYGDAVKEAATYAVADLDILAITPLDFVATKLEAFRGRGEGDYQASHDIEDVLAVLTSMSPLRHSIAHGTSLVERALCSELAVLGAREAFVDAVRGHFEGDEVGQERASRVIAWLASLVGE